MFLPLSSDAELRHWPVMTGILILLNLLAYPLQWSLPDSVESVDIREMMGDEGLRRMATREGLPPAIAHGMDSGAPVLVEMKVPGWRKWALSHGDGLHPLQWLSSMFLHGHLMHLLGNMLFLWVFGLVVEGRIGAPGFALFYLGCGIFQNFLGQTLFLFHPAAPSLGASGPIYSVMMAAALWAPGDNIQSVIGFVYFYWLVDIPVLILAAFYFLGDLGTSLFGSFEMSTALLHVMGGVVGLAVGCAALGLNLVDCDGKDMWSRFREAAGMKPLPVRRRKKTAAELAEEETALAERNGRLEVFDRTIGLHLADGRLTGAFETMKQRRKADPDSDWDEDQLVRILTLLLEQKRGDEFLHYSDQYLGRFAAKATAVRMNQARIQLEEKHRPRKCLEILRSIDRSALNERQETAFANLVETAQTRVQAGDLDFSG